MRQMMQQTWIHSPRAQSSTIIDGGGPEQSRLHASNVFDDANPPQVPYLDHLKRGTVQTYLK
jgi:hypothetical protein